MFFGKSINIKSEPEALTVKKWHMSLPSMELLVDVPQALVGDVRVDLWVVDTFLWPNSSWTLLRSAPWDKRSVV